MKLLAPANDLQDEIACRHAVELGLEEAELEVGGEAAAGVDLDQDIDAVDVIDAQLP